MARWWRKSLLRPLTMMRNSRKTSTGATAAAGPLRDAIRSRRFASISTAPLNLRMDCTIFKTGACSAATLRVFGTVGSRVTCSWESSILIQLPMPGADIQVSVDRCVQGFLYRCLVWDELFTPDIRSETGARFPCTRRPRTAASDRLWSTAYNALSVFKTRNRKSHWALLFTIAQVGANGHCCHCELEPAI